MRARAGIIALAMLGSLLAAPPAGAQLRSVELFAPRPFGHVLGDTLRLTVEIVLDAPFRLDPASLPRPRALDYWLDLVDVRLEDRGASGGAHRYALHLDYQTFYAPLEPKRMAIPAWTLAGIDGDRRVEIRVPAWSFVMSPLREIVPSGGASPLALRPDIAPRPISTTGSARGLAAGIALALAAFGTLAWQMGWGPFGRRGSRPFARAARLVRDALHASSTASDKSTGYRTGLIALHRAFDATARRGLFAEDLPAFLATHPPFRSVEADIRRLFAASRRAFFGGDVPGAIADLPPGELIALSRRLRAVERGSG